MAPDPELTISGNDEVESSVAAWRGARASKLRNALELYCGRSLPFAKDGSAFDFALLHHCVYRLLRDQSSSPPDVAAIVSTRPPSALDRGDTPTCRAWIVGKENCDLHADERYESAVHCYTGRSAQALRPVDSWVDTSALGDWAHYLADVGLIVLLERKTFSETTRSYTLSGLHGTVFSDSTTSQLRNTEALIHESAHTWLNMRLSALEERLPSRPTWYSPWKHTERPAHGIIHAGLTFAVLLRFWECYAERTEGDEGSYCRTSLAVHGENLVSMHRSFVEASSLLTSERLRQRLRSEYQRALDLVDQRGLTRKRINAKSICDQQTRWEPR